MIYQGLKYITQTSLKNMLKNKSDFDFFVGKEAIIIEHINDKYNTNVSHHFHHIEDLYDIILSNNIKIKNNDDSFSTAILNQKPLEFKFYSSFRYAKHYGLPAMINTQCLEQTILKNKAYKDYSEFLICAYLKGKNFFDTDDLIELLIKDKITLSPKGEGLASDFKSVILYHDLQHKIKENHIQPQIKI